METNKLNFALVDDDQMTGKIMRDDIASFFKNDRVSFSIFTSAKNYYLSITNYHYDLTFLDIEMPEMDGITLAKLLNKEGKKELIIYVSNREDLVFDSLATRPYGFVRKSHFRSDIDQVLKIFLADIDKEKQQILILNSNEGKVALNIKDIIYIESQKRNQSVFVNNHETPYHISSTLSELIEKLNDKGFINCCKGILVNYFYIRIINDDCLVLKNGATLPIARRRMNETKEEYMNIIKKKASLIF